MIWLTIIVLIILSILAGILGRLGGRGKDGFWYDYITDSKARDVGCSFITIIALWYLNGIHLNCWWASLFIFGLHWGAISTYWDWLFRGEDNLWFSGFCTGLALFPAALMGIVWWVILVRAIILAVIWGSLNKYLPEKVLLWRRDVAEEFLRYFSVVITLLCIFIQSLL